MRKLAILFAIGSFALMVGCGGSSNSGGGGGGSTPTITSVTASCSPATVTSGQTSQCTATVMGTGNFSSTVTWTTNAGQVSSSGLLTAPIVSSTTNVTVTATSTQDTTKSGTATVAVNPTASANNVAPIIVDEGPAGLNFISANVAFVTIQVCVPGSTTQCQTIDHVSVDTGSSGLRLLSSASGGEFSLSLPQEDNLAECLVFLDGYVWGTVAMADIYVAGEKAANVPVQVIIPSSSSPSVPSSCSSQNPAGGAGNEGDTLDAFGANALIGVGLFQQDCGPGCASNSPPPNFYYDCSSSPCSATNVPTTQQVANPVVSFATDNNGVLVQLPSVPNGGSLTSSGFLIFGIGTQSNNGLGSSMVYPVPDTGSNAGDFTTMFNGTNLTGSFIDSGSNGFFFQDSGITVCPSSPTTPANTWYCPSSSPVSLTAVNQGSNGLSGPTTHFSIENTIDLFNTSNTAFSTLGGPGAAGSFDWGLSFFYGRNVFTAIENTNAPGGTPPYFAYNLP